ncbi:MAG: xanthine dehydrogenase family protein subunit M [Acidobacteriota bacterium]
MIPAQFDYFAPQTVEEALSLLSNYGDEAKVLAGGHSLIPTMKLRLTSLKYLIDIGRIASLKEIKQDGNVINLGALVTHHAIEASPLLKDKCPLLGAVAAQIGDMQIRNRGTIGGSLVHSDPAADWPAGILALEAKISLAGNHGQRVINAEDFFVGMLQTAVQEGEILTSIQLPLTTGEKTAYLKVPQSASGFAIVGVAVRLRLDNAGRCSAAFIGVTGVADHAYRAKSVEAELAGKILDKSVIASASEYAADGIEPLSDIHASDQYRRHLAQVYTHRAILAALEG